MAVTIDRSSLRLFGMDLATVPGYLREGWSEALRWPVLRWLTPDDPVRVLHADGTESVRPGVSAHRIAAPAQVRFAAVELAEEALLRRSLLLPRLTEDELRQAVELDVRAASPFPEDDVVWGCDVERGDRLRVEIAEIGLAHDRERGDHDQHAFHHRRQIFGLVMPVRVVGVRRHRAQADGKECRDRGGDIDDALRRVGIERDAAGDAIGRVFERKHDHTDGNTAKGQPDDLLHDRKLALIGCGLR